MQKTRVFAAIDIGSYELAMKVFELSGTKGVRELDHVVHRLDLGTETYATGKISAHHVREIIGILKEYQEIMREYDVSAYRAVATSALRETRDNEIVLNLLRQETGVTVQILSNSEQRFLNYKAVALRGAPFEKIIEKPTAILDIGGGSIQLSIFDNDKLTATQNMRIGILRLQHLLQMLDASPEQYRTLLQELAGPQIRGFGKMYLRDHRIKNLILVDDYVAPFLQTHAAGGGGASTVKELTAFLLETEKISRAEIARRMDIPIERINLMKISALLIEYVATELGAEMLWAPGATLCDGLGFDYAEQKNYIASSHSFERDILASAGNMARRYMCGKKRSEALKHCAMELFDLMKKEHALSARERLLLEISALLYECGGYISMLNTAESAYHIIMSTEMIGLSHREREIVANTVRLAHMPADYSPAGEARMIAQPAEDTLRIAKLCAMLQLAAGLSRSSENKFGEMKLKRKERVLVIPVTKQVNTAVERGLLKESTALFREVYGIEPVIRVRGGA